MQPPAFRWCPMPENGHPVHTENEIGRKWTGQGGSRRWRCGAISMLCSRAMPTSLLRRSCTESSIGGRSGGVLPVGFWNLHRKYAQTDQQGERSVHLCGWTAWRHFRVHARVGVEVRKKDAGRRISKSSAFEITSWTGASTAMQPEDAPQKVFSQCRVFHAPRVSETEKETNANLPGWRWKKPKVTHVLFFKDRAKIFKDISWCPSFTESLVVWKIRLRERREEGPFCLVFFRALIYLYFGFEKFT